jgi:DNA-binding LytR/AlgR family response regulator
MIHCLIIDDESAARDILTHHIAKTNFLSLVDSTKSALEGIEIMNERNVDLVFLDIRMPDMSGIDFVKIMKGRCEVIFTSAYPEYAIDGYQLDVMDYLLKPISLPRFMQAVQKAWTKFSNISSNDAATVEGDHIFVKSEAKGKLVKIDFSEIDYIEGVRNYVAIHRGSTKSMVHISLKEIEVILPSATFIRIHRSFIVSLNKIGSIEANCILLKGVEQALPFGDSYKTEFFKRIEGRVI